jgi:hypothetical protein
MGKESEQNALDGRTLRRLKGNQGKARRSQQEEGGSLNTMFTIQDGDLCYWISHQTVGSEISLIDST